MLIEDVRLRSRLDERGIKDLTVQLMTIADRDMREALEGVDGRWTLDFGFEFSQAVAQLVGVTELEFHLRKQREELLGRVTDCLRKVPDRGARRRALRLVTRLQKDASTVAARAVR